jgi:hypothetical protein
LRQATRARYVQQTCDTMRRLKDLVRWAHPGLEPAFHGELTSATARAVLRARISIRSPCGGSGEPGCKPF